MQLSKLTTEAGTLQHEDALKVCLYFAAQENQIGAELQLTLLSTDVALNKACTAGAATRTHCPQYQSLKEQRDMLRLLPVFLPLIQFLPLQFIGLFFSFSQ